MKESIEKTIHDLGFAAEGLRGALGKANNVEALIVMDLIGRWSKRGGRRRPY